MRPRAGRRGDSRPESGLDGVTMDPHIVQSLATSDDEDVREIALARIVRKSKLTEEERDLLRENLPTLPHERLLEVLARHGDLGCPAVVVKRAIDDLPRDRASQFFYVHVLELLGSALDADAYADFVEKAAPILSPHAHAAVVSRLRGGQLFSAIAKSDSERPPWTRQVAGTPLITNLLDVRYDDRALRGRLEARTAAADLGELLRLTHVLQTAGVEDLAAAAWKRSLANFAFPFDPKVGEGQGVVRGYHWQLVQQWVTQPSPDRASRLGWLADRVVEMERGGASFFMMSQCDERLRRALLDDLAVVLIDRGEAPRWAGRILRERLATRTIEAWHAALSWWNAHGTSRLSWSFGEVYGEGKAMFMDAPLPEEPPEGFDEILLRGIAELQAYEQESIEHVRPQLAKTMGHDWMRVVGFDYAVEHEPFLSRQIAHLRPLITVTRIVDRLLQMPLTGQRATRIARMIKDNDELLRHPRLDDILATLAGPLQAEDLPVLNEANLHDERYVAVYRKLGGTFADDRLREVVRRGFAEIRATVDDDDGCRALCWWWPWLPEIVDDDMRSEMTAWAAEGSLRRAVRLYRAAPWLVSDEILNSVAKREIEAHRPWDRLNVPPVLRWYVEEQARRTDGDRELLAALWWLEENGAPRAARLGFILGFLARRPATSEIVDAAARMMSTRSAWEKDGPTLLRSIVRRDDWGSVAHLWYALAGFQRDTPDEDRGRLLAAIHLAFAAVLMERAKVTAEAGDDDQLATALAAVLQLDPPPPIVRDLAKLKRHPGLSERARKRIDAGMKLFKSMEGRTPGWDALFEAAGTMRGAAREMAATRGDSSPNEPA